MRSSIAGIICAFTFFCIVALDSNINNFPPLGRFLDPFQGFWQNEVKNTNIPEVIQLTGMTAEGKIYYDSMLIPHIYATNEHDLYLLQGYITARHRLWQMDFQSLAASGRLSEIFGEITVKYDKNMRRQGLQFGAEKFVKELKHDKKVFGLIEAYTEGVNAYIQQLEFKELPVEYKFFNYKPENWTPLKTALLFKFIQYSLSGPDYDFENSNALQLLGKKNFDLLFPDYLDIQKPIADHDSIWKDFDYTLPKRPKNYHALSGLRKHAVEKEDPDNGSNNWAVSGKMTKSGNPILCNDPHLNLTLPSIWFSCQLTTPQMNVMGMSIPGIPTIVSGFNENIAWGVTSARRDDRDWYKILFQDKSQTHYLIDNYWDKADLRIEEIKVRDKETIIDTVRYTIWGPVVYDKTFGKSSEKAGYALRWTAHDPSKELKTLYQINKASNYTEFNDALKYFDGPALNFAFISKDDDIAMNIQGKFPKHWEEQGKFVMDGTRSDTRWTGYIPQEHNIRIVNPKRGYVSSANEHPVNPNYPYYTYGQYYEYYRNRRIHTLLDSAKDLTIKDMEKMLNDNYSLFAEENLHFLLSHLNQINLTSEEKEIYLLLKAWNFEYNATETASIYLEEWVEALMNDIWDEINVHPNKAYRMPTRANTFYLLKHKPDFIFADELETKKLENIDDVINQAYHEAIAKVKKWQTEHPEESLSWTNFKKTKIMHMGRLPGFHVDHLKNGGHKGILNATKKQHGPSYRMIVEMTQDGPIAYQVIPGGQSGNPGSPYYDNMVPYFEAGDLIPTHFFKKNDFVISDAPEHLLKIETISK
ncbi:penicillin acylase family protein [Flammeovirga agarivorans]|uniref:Penicillin acylase family protein n=1 Tax=Flammeovirga agarivorans TaxID=2726742 RepID=A0A7X8SLA2_9BACT|nr:penicillin acylase family protein [Flammeovirga agarivorans]NLR92340.1 penicillin acylase family protein [Flammeovirga agarivorans]